MVKTKRIPGVEVNGSVHLFLDRQRHQHILAGDVTNHGAVVERVWDTNGNTYVQLRGEKQPHRVMHVKVADRQLHNFFYESCLLVGFFI